MPAQIATAEDMARLEGKIDAPARFSLRVGAATKQQLKGTIMKKLTEKQREVLQHMWSCWFARSMTLTDFHRQTVNSLEQAGIIAWDAEADAKPGASGPAKYGLTHHGFAVCEREFGPRRATA